MVVSEVSQHSHHDVRLNQRDKITKLNRLWHIGREEGTHLHFFRLYYACWTNGVHRTTGVQIYFKNYFWLSKWWKSKQNPWDEKFPFPILILYYLVICLMVSHLVSLGYSFPTYEIGQSGRNGDMNPWFIHPFKKCELSCSYGYS